MVNFSFKNVIEKKYKIEKALNALKNKLNKEKADPTKEFPNRAFFEDGSSKLKKNAPLLKGSPELLERLEKKFPDRVFFPGGDSVEPRFKKKEEIKLDLGKPLPLPMKSGKKNYK